MDVEINLLKYSFPYFYYPWNEKDFLSCSPQFRLHIHPNIADKIQLYVDNTNLCQGIRTTHSYSVDGETYVSIKGIKFAISTQQNKGNDLICKVSIMFNQKEIGYLTSQPIKVHCHKNLLPESHFRSLPNDTIKRRKIERVNKEIQHEIQREIQRVVYLKKK
jgi:hypothetical protein